MKPTVFERAPARVSGGEGRLEQALAHADDGAFVIDAEGRIVLWNRVAEGIMGYLAHEVIGQRCGDIFVAHDGERNRLCNHKCRVAGHVRLSEDVHSIDVCTRTKEGKRVWINVSSLVLGANSVAGPSTIHLFRDVTASRELLRLVDERFGQPAGDRNGSASLTPREVEVLRLMTSGANTAATAKELRVSPATVRNHIQSIFSKLGVHSRLEAVAYVNNHRIVAPW